MPLQITMNPRPAGNLSISANQRARFSSVVSLGWDQITGKPTITDFAETLLDDETAAAARATLGLTDGTGVREVLTANRDYYVRSDGSDSNTGLANTAAGAFLTIQKAWSVIHDSLDLNGYKVTINVGAGTFAGAAFTGPPVGGGGDGPGPVILLGAGAASTTINSTVIVKDHGRLQIGSFKIATASGSGILIQNHSTVYLYDGGMEFGACATSLVNAYNCSALIGQTGFGFTISGGATYGFLVSTLSNVTLSASATYTITGTPAFSTAFVCCIDNSVFNPGTGSAFSGSATGPRYNLTINSAIDMEDITANLPGDSAGSVTWGSSFYATNAIDVIGVGSRTLQLVDSDLVVTPQSSGFASWSSGNLTSVGSTILAAANGGTGINNSPYTITLSGSSVYITPALDGVATWSTGTLAGSFYKFTGPTTSVKTFTLPDQSTTIATVLSKLSVFASTTSAELFGVISDETGGSGVLVGSASPAFTGTPTAPTAAVDTNTTQLATTAYVVAQAGAATPLGCAPTAVVGTSTRFARADHVHPGREVLTANRTYYVRTDGSNSNTGLANTAGGAFLTIQKAVDVACALDFSIYSVTIQVGSGTYTGAVVVSPYIGAGPLLINGDTSTPTNCVISVTSATAVKFQNGPPLVQLRGFQISTTTSGFPMYCALASNVQYGSMVFAGAPAGYAHIYMDGQSSITATANYEITSGPYVHIQADFGSMATISSRTITLTGTPAFSSAFIFATRGGGVAAVSDTFTGSATGARYIANVNAWIDTGGGGASYLPGNSAGSTATGGQYA